MIKKITIVILMFTALLGTVYAASGKFKIDVKDINDTLTDNKETATSSFSKDYAINYDSTDLYNDKEFQKKMSDLTNKTTTLLIGEPNSKTITNTDYAKRKNELYELRYAPEIPKKADGKLDETTTEYRDDTATGINIPGMLKLLSEKNIKYKNYGIVKVFETKDYIITRTALSGVTIEWENETDPFKLDLLETNLVMTYFYKLYKGEYKLYWIMAETEDDVSGFFDKAEANENIMKNSKYVAEVSNFYDYSKLSALTEVTTNDIYNKNVNNIVLLNTYYDKNVVNSGVGFFIGNGIIATSWDFVSQSLEKGQLITITDNKGNIYEYDGFVTATPELDIAIIKLSEKTDKKVIIGNSKELIDNDPVITISTKTGIGLSLSSGIMIANGAMIKNLLPLSSSDEGSPLFNTKGEVIGINTSKSIDSSISLAVSSTYLSEIAAKLDKQNFDDIIAISFDKLKEKYYFNIVNEELIVNNLKDSIWKEYQKIGDIKNTIFLPLTKASYYDGVVSLRYKNEISEVLSNMKMTSSFAGDLIENGYKEIYKSDVKKVYENGKYKVVIMDEFNSLIILLVKK